MLTPADYLSCRVECFEEGVEVFNFNLMFLDL